MNDQIAALIVAAGTASRYGSDKLLDTIAGRPTFLWALSAFVQVPEIDRIVVVTRSDLIDQMRSASAELTRDSRITFTAGGARRQDSVAAGLAEAGEATVVVVHDCARPMVTPDVIRRSIAAVHNGADAAVAAVPVTDTLKRRIDDGVSTVDRTNLWRAQTPQAFRASTLRAALKRADVEGLDATDEASLIERFGGTVALVDGDERNLKLTVPGDRSILEALILAEQRPRQTRSGIGYDVHRLVENRPLVLGGVDIPHPRGLDGHSDADVVLHAACDALLGACALGDIGQHFPPTDESFRGISSLTLLEKVIAIMGDAGFSAVNIDIMVIAELPKIGPHVQLMRERIARSSGLSIDVVSIKATTNEGLGFAGRQEGIAALATATVLAPA